MMDYKRVKWVLAKFSLSDISRIIFCSIHSFFAQGNYLSFCCFNQRFSPSCFLTMVMVDVVIVTLCPKYTLLAAYSHHQALLCYPLTCYKSASLPFTLKGKYVLAAFLVASWKYWLHFQASQLFLPRYMAFQLFLQTI